MQRKVYPLKKRGMAMLMAIFLLVIIGTIMGVSLSMSGTTTAKTTNDYLHEQAMLLGNSATEYAVLALSGRARANPLNQINAVYPNTANPMFNIVTTIGYVDGLTASGQNPNPNASVMIDVVVTSDPALGISETIRYHRRTIQKL